MFCHCSVKGLKFRHSAENMVSFLREMKCGKQSVIGALVLAVENVALIYLSVSELR
jgi:hypothetical protein